MSRRGWGVLFTAGVAGFEAAMYALADVGTCASGGPYVIENECPGGTGWWIALMLGSLMVALVGGAGLGVVAPGEPTWWRRKGGLVPLFAFVLGTVEFAMFAVLTAAVISVAVFAPWSDASDGAGEDSLIFAGGLLALGIGGWLVGKWLGRLASAPRPRKRQRS